VIEVLNSFWALEFRGTILKVIWVSGPRQIDAQTDTTFALIYKIVMALVVDMSDKFAM